MLDDAVTQVHDLAATPDDPRRIDRSMDALQYVIALLAIVAAVALASVR